LPSTITAIVGAKLVEGQVMPCAIPTFIFLS